MGALRRSTTRCFGASCLLLLAFVAAAVVGAGEPAAGEGSIRWARSFEMALEEAAVRDLPVMVDFWTSWCHWCRVLDRETYRDPKVVKRSERFVCVKVDAQKRLDLARRYRIRSYPTIAFLHADGSVIGLVRGYQPPKAFARELDEITDSRAEEFTLRQRLKDHPDLLEIRHDLALLLLRRGAVGESLEQFETLWAANSRMAEEDRWELTLDRGRALHRAGRHREAATELERFVRRRKDAPRLSEAIYYLGEALLAGDRPKEARKWFRKLLEVESEGWLAEQSRSRLADLG